MAYAPAINQSRESIVESEDAPESLRFERREVDRWPLQGVATAFCVSGEDFGAMASLRLLDYSHYGMGATSDTPMNPGMEISIGFQSPGYPAKRGVVQRCMPCGNGYRVAIQFELSMVA